MRALVIGGTQFMGRALVERLLARGDDVTILHRSRGTPFGERVTEIRCDRNDVAGVRAALAGRAFDAVFDNVYDWQRGTDAVQVGAAAEAVAPGLSRYVFTSSIAVYAEGEELDEDSPLKPADSPDEYGRNKAESERTLFRLHRDHGLPVTTLRPVFVYGPGNVFDREAFFWDRILAGRPILVPGDGSRRMQWVHADDVAAAALMAVQNDGADGRAYNVAGEPITQVAFVRALARAAGREATLVPVPRETLLAAGGGLMEPPLYFGAYLDVPPLTVRTERLRTELGVQPRPLDEGLRETFEWYQRQARPEPDFTWEDEMLAGVVESVEPNGD